MAANNYNPVDLRDNRYNHIVHLVSAANGAEDFYTTEVSWQRCGAVRITTSPSWKGRTLESCMLAGPHGSQRRYRHG